MWIYNEIINTHATIRKLSCINNLAYLALSKCCYTISTAASECLLGIIPLYLVWLSTALATPYRLIVSMSKATTRSAKFLHLLFDKTQTELFIRST